MPRLLDYWSVLVKAIASSLALILRNVSQNKEPGMLSRSSSSRVRWCHNTPYQNGS